MKLRGKGHEASDLDKIMNMYRGWHREFAPKLEFSYFAERVSKFSNSKDVKEHMEKLRGVYKGETDHYVPFGNIPDGQINLKDYYETHLAVGQADQPMQITSGAKATDKNEGIPNFSYQDYGNDKENHGPIDNGNEQFRMLDVPEEPQFAMINTCPQKGQRSLGLTEQSAALTKNPSLSEEQMRKMEENRRKAIERKRKSELMDKERDDIMEEDVGIKKRQKIDNDEVSNTLPITEKPSKEDSDDCGDIEDADLAEYIE